MGIALGGDAISKLYLGSTLVDKLCLGETVIYNGSVSPTPSGYTELNNNVVLLAHLNTNTNAQTSGDFIESYEFNNLIDSTDSKFLTGSMSCIDEYGVSSDPYSITTSACTRMEELQDQTSQSIQAITLCECWVKNSGYFIYDGEESYWDTQDMMCINTTYDGGLGGYYIQLLCEGSSEPAQLVVANDDNEPEIILDSHYENHYQDWTHIGFLQVGQSLYACYNGTLTLVKTANKNLTPTTCYIYGDDHNPTAKFCEFRISLANNLCNCDLTNLTYTVPTQSFSDLS